MSSWKEILQDVMKERDIPKGGTQTVEYRYTLNKGHRLKRTRDPITHRFYDPKKEECYNRRLSKFFSRHQERAVDRRIYSEGSYDIISLTDRKTNARCANIEPIQSKKKERNFTNRCGVDLDSMFGKNVKLSDLRNRRDYHIINNEYKKNHEEQQNRRDKHYRKNVLNHVKVLVSKGTISNPILHVDGKGKRIVVPKKKIRRSNDGEKTTKERRMIFEAKKEKKQVNRMIRMRNSEKKVERTREGLKNQRKMRKRNRGNKLVENRDRPWVDRGYDIMSNVDYRGLNEKKSRPMFVPNLCIQKNHWEEIKRGGKL